MLLSADFETDPLAAAWSAEASEGQPAPAWIGAGGHSGTHCLLATAGTWQSPAFPVTPFEYYRLEFWSRAEGTEYFAAFFYDEQGQTLEADHYSSVDPSTNWKLQTLCFRAKARAATARILFQPLKGKPFYVDDVSVRLVTRAEATAWADEVYAQIPPVPPGGTGVSLALPRTFARLQRAGTLRVVMLGDSIINDTGSSPWDLLVERTYPGARVEVVTSVGGGKGCWYYQEDNRVQSYVLDYRPDLLIIGGLSQRGDLEAIREVIHQVRAHAQPEILLMSGIFGKGEDPRERSAASLPPENGHSLAYRRGLRRLAEEEGVALYDLSAAWAQYMRGIGTPYDYFMRDAVHANERGRALAARLIAGYFAPEQPCGEGGDKDSGAVFPQRKNRT
jgi:hypothetical protein